MSSKVDNFLERLQEISPAKGKKNFVKRRTIDKVFCNFPGNYGKYQLLPMNDVVTNFPFVSLTGTREINMPRKNMAADGTEKVYDAWIKILPLSAYQIREGNALKSSLSAADESLLRQAYAVFDELYNELDVRNNAMNPEVKEFIRKKNYTIWNARALNFWQVGNTTTPVRTNFSGLFVVTAKDFTETIASAIQDTSLMAGSPDWVDDVYNRNVTGRKGLMLFSISKKDGPGFNISISHQLGAEQYLSGVAIPEEEADLMSNTVEEFLGWQAAHDDESPAEQKHLFNKSLIEETIQFMTTQLAAIRMSKQKGTSVAEAIEATNNMVLSGQEPTNTLGQATNDPILAQMAEQENKPTVNAEVVKENNTNPFQTPPAAHIDPVAGTPVSEPAPFSAPNFGGFNGGERPF